MECVVKSLKDKEYEILGRALDIYRDNIDVNIDIKDFTNVAVATIRAIKEMETGKDYLDKIKLEVFDEQEKKA